MSFHTKLQFDNNSLFKGFERTCCTKPMRTIVLFLLFEYVLKCFVLQSNQNEFFYFFKYLIFRSKISNSDGGNSKPLYDFNGKEESYIFSGSDEVEQVPLVKN